jgi:hypothetical protein
VRAFSAFAGAWRVINETPIDRQPFGERKRVESGASCFVKLDLTQGHPHSRSRIHVVSAHERALLRAVFEHDFNIDQIGPAYGLFPVARRSASRVRCRATSA